MKLTDIDRERMAHSIRAAMNELERKARFYCYEESAEHQKIRAFLLQQETALREEIDREGESAQN